MNRYLMLAVGVLRKYYYGNVVKNTMFMQKMLSSSEGTVLWQAANWVSTRDNDMDAQGEESYTKLTFTQFLSGNYRSYLQVHG